VFVLTHRMVTARRRSPSGDHLLFRGPDRCFRHGYTGAAAGKDVIVFGANLALQCLRADLLDEIVIHLVPVLVGDGVRLIDTPDLRPVASTGHWLRPLVRSPTYGSPSGANDNSRRIMRVQTAPRLGVHAGHAGIGWSKAARQARLIRGTAAASGSTRAASKCSSHAAPSRPDPTFTTANQDPKDLDAPFGTLPADENGGAHVARRRRLALAS
jgi:hypothetical protein